MNTTLSKEKRAKARSLGKAIGKQLSLDFWVTHPEYRGTSMTRKNFPKFVFDLAAVQTCATFQHTACELRVLERICATSARKAAIKWLAQNP